MGERKTYIINIDGMRGDYVGTIGHQGCLTPTLNDLALQGIQFRKCSSTMPANTGTNHTAILTSTTAGSHGILGIGGYFSGLDFNHWRWSRHYGKAQAEVYEHHHVQIPTLFNIVKQQNLTAKTAFITGKTWLGSILPDEDCDITIYPGNTTEHCGVHEANPSYVTPPYGYVLGGTAHPEDNELLPRVYIPSTVDGDAYHAPPGSISASPVDFDADKLPSDQWIMDQALACIDHNDPDMMYLVLMNMDLAGHAYGAFITKEGDENDDNLSLFRNPQATKDQLFLTDAQIQRFIHHLQVKGLYDDARIIITSDHGMSTMKALFSAETRQEFLNWMTSRVDALTDPSIISYTEPFSQRERLDIDIRQILEDNGIHMRASMGRLLHRYNPQGHYDWCISEGPNAYIYNAEPSVQEEIKQILLDYTIQENEQEEHPIWKVLTQDEQDTTINEHTGESFNLGKGNYADVIWPSVMIFCHPHYMVPMYNDQLQSALMPLMIKMKLPGFIDVRTAMGAHGTYQEQHVPLILVSPSEPMVPENVISYKQVSLIDIAPTITSLNEWALPPSFQGESLV